MDDGSYTLFGCPTNTCQPCWDNNMTTVCLLRVVKVALDLLDYLDPVVQQVQLVRLVRLVCRVSRVPVEVLELLVILEIPGHKVAKVLMETRASRATKVRKDRKGLLDLPDRRALLVSQELQVREVTPDSLEILGLKDVMDHQVNEVNQACQDFREASVGQDRRASKGQRVIRDLQASLVHKARICCSLCLMSVGILLHKL